MREFTKTAPDAMPVLSRGRHHSPRSGACFMEFASYLAGEKWSDHPSCTHPVLASLARAVNDTTTNQGRSKLAILIPSVVGLNGYHPQIPLVVCTIAAAAALPVAAETRQRALAAGLLRCELSAANVDGELGAGLRRDIHTALISAPAAEKWARDFVRDAGVTKAPLDERTIDLLIGLSVTGISEACVSDPDAILRGILTRAIDATSDVLRPTRQNLPQLVS